MNRSDILSGLFSGRLVHLLFACAFMGFPMCTAAEETTFPLKAVSTLTTEHRDHLNHLTWPGETAFSQETPHEEVTAYPKFKSDRPIYGRVTFAANHYTGEPGTTYHFALDEADGANNKAVRKLTVAVFGGDNIGRYVYDELYFDADQDRDLTNNEPIAALAKIPSDMVMAKGPVRHRSRIYPEMTVGVEVEGQQRDVRLIPFLRNQPGWRPEALVFLSPNARHGTIEVSGRPFEVLLSQVDRITGGLDQPLTRLYIKDLHTSKRDVWWLGADWLCAMRRVNGQLYQFAASESGNELTISPYAGDYGSLEIRTHAATAVDFSGPLLAKSKVVVPLGIDTAPSKADRSERFRVPVGDYTPLRLMLDAGRTRARFATRLFGDTPRKYPIHVKKDQSVVLNLSERAGFEFEEPEVNREKRETIIAGDRVRFHAALIDPALGVVSGLWDKQQQEFIDGVEEPIYGGIHGTAIILDSAGTQIHIDRKVSWGTPHFWFDWTAPARLAGKRETFTIRLSVDTFDLYGVVEGRTTLKVESPAD